MPCPGQLQTAVLLDRLPRQQDRLPRHLAPVPAAAACSRAQPGVPRPAVPPVEGQCPLSLGHSVLPQPGRWHCSSTLRPRFLSASAGAQKSNPLQCLPALWQCKVSLTPQKKPICQVRNTNPLGKAGSCAPPAWLRPLAGPSEARAAPRMIPSWFWGHTVVALGWLCHSGCITSVLALGTLLSQAAHEQELPALPSTGHLSHSLWMSSGHALPLRVPMSPCCCGAPTGGGRGLLLGKSHIMLAGMPKFSFSEQKGGAPWLGS